MSASRKKTDFSTSKLLKDTNKLVLAKEKYPQGQ